MPRGTVRDINRGRMKIDKNRQQQMHDRFLREFGRGGELRLVRAPGRVNLIGEHTDYSGLPVFPIAIQKDVAILFRPRRDREVHLVDLREKYGRRDFNLSSKIEPYPTSDWGNYVKAAAQTITDRFGGLTGFDAVISGEVPPAAGLSSSSAMVVACALTFIASNEIAYDRNELMDLLAVGERYVGTQGGGMDQAICLGGQRDSAVKIDFFPLSLDPVPIPAGWSFVIAHSLSVASKSGEVRHKYNQRPIECRQALETLNRRANRSDQPWTYSQWLKQTPLDGLLLLIEDALDPLERSRFRHVVSEGSRVEEARTALLADDINRFAELMCQSHRSLRDDFEVSSPELDLLVERALSFGALGARMTGAGFGGCIVALCKTGEVAGFMDRLESEFYAPHPETHLYPAHLLIAQPVEGAEVLY